MAHKNIWMLYTLHCAGDDIDDRYLPCLALDIPFPVNNTQDIIYLYV